MDGSFTKKLHYILCCLLLNAAAICCAQGSKEIDSLQQEVDSLSRAGLNHKAAFEQGNVYLGQMYDTPGNDVKSYYLTAKAYIRSREYDDAFFYSIMALDKRQRENNPVGIAQCYTIMAQVYLYKKDYNKAEDYNRKALSIFSRYSGKKGEAATAKVVYADFFMERRNYPQALKFLADALDETPANEFYNLPAYIKDRIGLCYFLQGKTDQAERYFMDALSESKKDPYVDIMMSVQRHLGELFLSQKDYAQAQLWLEKAIALRPGIEDSEEFMLANKSMAKVYEEQGKYEEAYNYQMDAVMASREVMSTTTLTGTDAVSTKFDAEQVELQNELLETEAETREIEAQQADSRKNAYMLFFLFTVIVLATVLLFLYLYFRQKKAMTTNRNNDLKQKLLLTQMNPHFIFNSVDNIQGLIYEGKNDEAEEYLSKFSELTLQILENSSQQYITLKEEVSMTANYLVIQQLLYNNFEFDITVSEGIDTETMLIPPMLTQPFIENAIKHGIAGKKEGGQINIRFYKAGRHLCFEVSDNGRGLTGKSREGHRSMATGITSERLGSIKGHTAIEVSNIVEGGIVRGAMSRLVIPYKMKKR